ncbi:MAG: protein kinase [Proteobacteria bacterium]|nr:protein kinase [Pseudomonadota bacterium]
MRYVDGDCEDESGQIFGRRDGIHERAEVGGLQSLSVPAGTIIGERYRVVRHAGHGGMGSVYEAADIASGQRVAVKIAHHGAPHQHGRRLLREARALAERLSRLQHAGIVAHADHGIWNGVPFLVMEWLDGCDLDARIQNSWLGESEAIAVAVQVASAIAAAQRQGVIHRDIKPRNLFLVGGDINRVKLLDFGLVRVDSASTVLTEPGAAVGTPGFMAPEQARGQVDIDTRADLYSLGAVLFACLTGRPPFVGDHLMAIVAKMLLQPAPRVRDYRADISPQLDELIQCLLRKNPAERPASAEELEAVLADLGNQRGAGRTTASVQAAVSAVEQQYVSIVLVGQASQADHGPGEEARSTPLEQRAAGYQASLDCLVDGTRIAVLRADDDPVQMATRAARLALEIHARVPTVPVAVATGRSAAARTRPAGNGLVGEAIDRAVSLLVGSIDRSGATDRHRSNHRPSDRSTLPDYVPEHRLPLRYGTPDHSAANRASIGVLACDTTRGLLEQRFQFRCDERMGDSGHILLAENVRPHAVRRFLGQPTEFVGRDRELAGLEAIFGECVDQSAARAVLITGPAGAGKSRLAHEFIHRLRGRDNPPAIWLAHGDSMRAGSSLGLLAQLIGHAVDITPADTPRDRQARLRHHVQMRVALSDADRIAMFLGEIIARSLPDDNRPARRRDSPNHARSVHDHMLLAWQDWLESELQRRPVVCVLDDLHWGDVPSVRFVDAALRNLADHPLMIVALARLDIDRVFPDLWAARDLERTPLRPLSRRSCMKLARRFLAVEVSDDAVEKLARRSGGNPFFLEELLRGPAASNHEELPDTILATIALRLNALPIPERRFLRAASVFGNNFWPGGVAELLHVSSTEIAQLVASLADRELIRKQRSSRLVGQEQYTFHHALTREAAYAMLTADDQSAAHRAAGRWLERAGESDPVVLAQHYRCGHVPGRAIHYYHRSAALALDADDVNAVIDHASRAIECGARGKQRGALLLLQAEAHNWLGQHELACDCADRAMPHLTRGSDLWADAIHQLVWGSYEQGNLHKVEHLADEIASYIRAVERGKTLDHAGLGDGNTRPIWRR